VILHHLQAYLPHAGVRILDVGGGAGEMAADLAKLGHIVTLLDFSPAMVEQASQHCVGLGVTLECADVGQLPELFPAESFDLVLCHSLLEFLEQPAVVLVELARVVQMGGLLSVVVGNRYHFPLRAALVRKDFCQARRGLDDEISAVDLFGLPRRTFYPEEMQHLIQAARMRLIGEYGVRIFADLLGDAPEPTDDLLALELAASSRLPFRRLARFIQFISKKE
jgi:ubiquinone/menaquinone biosynthesis C-methylase UbiE